MNIFIKFLSKLGFWPFVLFLSVLSIILSEFLMLFLNHYLREDVFTKELMIIVFFNSFIGTLIVSIIVAYLVKYLHTRQEELELMSYAFSKVNDESYLVNEKGYILKANEAACKELGYTKAEMESMSVFDISTVPTKDNWPSLFQNAHTHIVETKHIRKDKSEYDVEISSTNVEYLGKKYNLSFSRNITKKKKQEKKLKYLAHYDALTNLPNRVLLADRIDQAMGQVTRREDSIAIAYIDLDGFKEVNDNYGHDTGDILLKSLALKMNELLRKGDTIARIGGDEFIALLANISDEIEVNNFLNRLLSTLSKPMDIKENAVQVSASIGVSMYPQSEEISSTQLIRQADQAMYQAKSSGKNKFIIFDSLAEFKISR